MEQLSSRFNFDALVNYPRRYDQNFNYVDSKIKGQKIKKIFLRYSKGALHNLPHFINILHWYCGRLSEIKYSQKIKRNEFIDVEGIYIFGNTEVIISSLDYQLFDHYELDILLEKKMFRFHDGGLKLEEFTATKRFSEKTLFLESTKTFPSSSNNSMSHALDALIHGGNKIHTSISDDYNIYKDIKKILDRSTDV